MQRQPPPPAVVTIRGIGSEELVGRALKLLNRILIIFITSVLQNAYGAQWFDKAVEASGKRFSNVSGSNMSLYHNFDSSALIQIIINLWKPLFEPTGLTYFQKSLLHELQRTRNDWAHQFNFTIEDTYRALDGIERIARAFKANEEALIVEKTRKLVLVEMAQRAQREQHLQNVPDLTTIIIPAADPTQNALNIQKTASHSSSQARPNVVNPPARSNTPQNGYQQPQSTTVTYNLDLLQAGGDQMDMEVDDMY